MGTGACGDGKDDGREDDKKRRDDDVADADGSDRADSADVWVCFRGCPTKSACDRRADVMHVTHHTSQITQPASYITKHTSRHTSHVTCGSAS